MRAGVLAAFLLFSPCVALRAQVPYAEDAIYRVFLMNGAALPSYGEAVQVGDRLIFNLTFARADGRLQLVLITLPVERVDLIRTQRYAQAMRAAVYARTRGEVEYSAMLQGFSEELAAIAALNDRAEQIRRARLARQRLLLWPSEHHKYRAEDVRELVAAIVQILAEPNAGPTRLALDLSYDTGPALLSAPRAEDSVYTALLATEAADVGDERLAILRTARSWAPSESVRRLSVEFERELEAELRYTNLFHTLRRRADAARRLGQIAAVEALQRELHARDAAFGRRRPQQVRAMDTDLSAALSAARARRAALDRYAAVLAAVRAYQRQVTPLLTGLRRLDSTLTRLRDLEPVPYTDLLAADAQLSRWREMAESIQPPVDVAGTHATVSSAIRLAQEGCVRARLAAVSGRDASAREAASAASGALLLGERARADLDAALLPPRD
jgi:hypothetical protein